VAEITEFAYKWALNKGIAKEQARAVLPEGITKSRMYMAGTLRSWVHYIQLRSANGTQKEHQEIAIECANVIETVFPMIKEFVNV
jgi:thymidylate synthase (FAD)